MVAMPSVNAAACVACILPTADACVVVGADIDVQQTSKHANRQTNEHTDMFASYCCIQRPMQRKIKDYYYDQDYDYYCYYCTRAQLQLKSYCIKQEH